MQESLTPSPEDWNKHKDMCMHTEMAKGKRKAEIMGGPDLPWIFPSPPNQNRT